MVFYSLFVIFVRGLIVVFSISNSKTCVILCENSRVYCELHLESWSWWKCCLILQFFNELTVKMNIPFQVENSLVHLFIPIFLQVWIFELVL